MKIFIDDKFDYFEIKLGFKEKIASFHGSFEKVPLSKVKSVSNDIPQKSWKDMKNPGTDLPGFRAGSFTTLRGHEFWYANLKKESNFLVIELQDDTYDRIILTVDNNTELKEKFDRLIEKR
ncbi:hypothetical protein [Nitrosopumilus sp.]|uniref:hypothetical protein n=1 Tax=Nitrosopumilus sp. TaxID=2024843 RepID=UPI00292DFC42|nr:hypothetical protein [Nitrosopumilus sp.]